MDKRWSLIALHRIQGVGWHTIDRLLKLGWRAGEEITSDLLHHLASYKIPARIILKIRETYSPKYVVESKETLEKMDLSILTIWDDDYPERLRHLAQPPWVLYLRGECSLLHSPCLGMVGTRKPTPYGKNATHLFAGELARSGWTIVSGLARGIDGIAHESTLGAEGKTIAVLASGIDVVYPKQHQRLYERIVEKGLVLTEMPPGTQALPGLFPQRNRLVSGLSQGVLVVEAAEKSGSLITADFALEQGKDVFAIPGSIFLEQSRGVLRLIQQGAKCVIDPQEILEEYNHFPLVNTSLEIAVTQERQITLNDPEQKVWDIVGSEPVQLTDLLTRLSSLTLGEIHRTLLQLEMKGYIQQLPGSRYIRGRL